MQAADINDIWERILQVAKQTLPPAIYSSLSTSLIPMSIDNNSIHIGVMQSFIKSVIESQQTVSKLLTDASDRQRIKYGFIGFVSTKG